MSMGDYIVIERQVGPYSFEACSVSTGTEFLAHIDKDKQGLFADGTWIRDHPGACPFLRPSGDRVICCIHETSPAQCKAYRCVVFRIRSPDGRPAGYVTGTLALHTSDPALREVWEEGEKAMAKGPVFSEESIVSFISSRGYTCE